MHLLAGDDPGRAVRPALLLSRLGAAASRPPARHWPRYASAGRDGLLLRAASSGPDLCQVGGGWLCAVRQRLDIRFSAAVAGTARWPPCPGGAEKWASTSTSRFLSARPIRITSVNEVGRPKLIEPISLVIWAVGFDRVSREWWQPHCPVQSCPPTRDVQDGCQTRRPRRHRCFAVPSVSLPSPSYSGSSSP